MTLKSVRNPPCHDHRRHPAAIRRTAGWNPAVLLFLLLPLVGAAQPADVVVVNGDVLTVDPAFRRASAVAIRDGVFVAVGSNAEIRRWVGGRTRIIDAGGRTVIPGLIETHVHATGAARGEAVQPFEQLHSIEEIREWVRRKAAEARPGEWIRLPRVDVTRIREPYGPGTFSLYGISDPEHRGHLHLTPEKLKNMIRTGHRMGWQMSSHVTGDAALDAVLDAVEAADADSPIAPRRYNLIHAYFPSPESAARAARLGVCADTQPTWYYKDGDALADALGPHRLENFIGLQTWRRAGVKVAINSDHMEGADPDTSLNPYNPFLAMQVAITRRTEAGRIIGAHQRTSGKTRS